MRDGESFPLPLEDALVLDPDRELVVARVAAWRAAVPMRALVVFEPLEHQLPLRGADVPLEADRLQLRLASGVQLPALVQPPLLEDPDLQRRGVTGMRLADAQVAELVLPFEQLAEPPLPEVVLLRVVRAPGEAERVERRLPLRVELAFLEHPPLREDPRGELAVLGVADGDLGVAVLGSVALEALEH